MLNRILTVARIALALAGAFAFFAVGMAALRVPPILTHLDGVLTRAEAVESKIYASAGNLDAATRTWAAAAKDQTAAVETLTTDAHGAILSAQGAINETRETVSTINAQAAHVGPLLDAARAAADSLPPAVAGLQRTEDAGTKAVADLDALATDKHLASLLAHADSISGNADLMLADAEWKAHRLLHPDKVKLTFWGGVWAGALKVHELLPPLF